MLPAGDDLTAPLRATVAPPPGHLLRVARILVGLVADHHPGRAEARLTRESRAALARNEAALAGRERDAYRDWALGRPIR